MADASLARVIRFFGSRAALARALKISRQTVSLWTRVPPERVMAIEQLTGVPRSQLRPDLYPRNREKD